MTEPLTDKQIDEWERKNDFEHLDDNEVVALIAEVRRLREVLNGQFLFHKNEELYQRVQRLTAEVHEHHVVNDPECELCEDPEPPESE